MKINGVIVPLLTPLNEDETLDMGALKRLIDHVIEGGVAAIFVMGSTGEAASLTLSEKQRLVAVACEYINGRVPMLVGVIESGTTNSVEQTGVFTKLGADAIVATAPYYFEYSQKELRAHFQDIAANSDVPIIAYNIPALAKAVISPELMCELLTHEGIIGIKDSAGDLGKFQSFLNLQKQYPAFQVWQGAEAVAAISVARGADGLVLGLANIAPKLCVDLYNTAQKGDFQKAWDLQNELMILFGIQRYESFLAGLKGAAHLLGLCGTAITKPFKNLDNEQLALVRQTLVELQLL